MLEKSWRVRPGRECRKCGEFLLARMKSSKSNGLEKICRACASMQSAEWNRKNSARVALNAKAYRNRNIDAVRQRDRDRNRGDARRQWRLNNYRQNPGPTRSAVSRRRALLKGATVEQFVDSEVFNRDRYICYLCGRVTDPSLKPGRSLKTVLEHRIPLVRGGEHSRANCATACWECNARKGSLTDSEFLTNAPLVG